MSQENLETTRRFTEALNRGDYKTAAAELDPELEIDDGRLHVLLRNTPSPALRMGDFIRRV